MTKNDYIKVSGMGFSKVILAANASFYKEHGYQIDEATDEEIHSEFPEYQFAAPVEADPEEQDEDQEEETTDPVDESPEAPKKRKYTRKATN